MNFFAACGLATFVSSTSFGIFTLFNCKKTIHKIWAIFNFTVAVWGFCAFKFATALSPEHAFFWLYTGHIGVVLIPVTYLHFVLELLEMKRPLLLRLGYQVSGVFLVLNLCDFAGITKLFITNVTYVFNEFYVDRPPGPTYPAFVAFFFGLVGYSHWLAVREVRRSRGLKRTQINYFLWAMAPAFYGGGTAFIMVFGIDFYPYLHVTVPFYPVVMTYAIVRHKMLDIQITDVEKARLRAMLAVTGSINHEIRNPLGFIVEDLNRMMTKVEGVGDNTLKSEMQSCLNQIDRHVRHVIEVTRTMSQYAKPVKALTASESVDLALVCSEAVAEFRDKSLSDGRVAIDFETSKHTLYAYGDKVFIKESIRNFLDNALFAIDKGRPSDGSIRVRVREDGSKWVGLSISDNGCGIAPEELERVFDLGFSHREHDGFKHGAGLFLVKWYADQMKAKLNIESKLGEGTTVYVRFRRAATT